MKLFYEYNNIDKSTEWSFADLLSAKEIKQPAFFDSVDAILKENKTKNCLIYTDYDTDGLTSGLNLEAILSHFFKEVIVTSNNKAYEGYNLVFERITKKMAEFKDQSLDVVIVTADVGVTDVAVMNEATSLDNVAYTITLDHHENFKTLPNTTYLVDLKLDTNLATIDREYCTAGLTWLWAMQIAKKSGDDNLVDKVMQYLPWTAIATIADVVPLNYGNFAIIDKGLSMINNNQEYAFKKSMDLFRTEDDSYENISYLNELLSRDIGFSISPLLNASTRMTGTTKMSIAAIKDESFISFNLLKSLNEKRKLATKVAEISSKTIFNNNGFVVSFIDPKFLDAKLAKYKEDNQGREIHDFNKEECLELLSYASGLAGIVAGNVLKETKEAKASFTGTNSVKVDDDGNKIMVFHGSLRARPGVNLVKALNAAKDKWPNIVSGGGHAAAAGLSIIGGKGVSLAEVLELMSVEINKYQVEKAVVFPSSELNVVEFMQLPLVFGMGRNIPAFKFKYDELELVSPDWEYQFKRSNKKGTMYFTPRVRFQNYEFAMQVYHDDYEKGFDFNNMLLVPGWGSTQHGKELVFRPMEVK